MHCPRHDSRDLAARESASSRQVAGGEFCIKFSSTRWSRLLFRSALSPPKHSPTPVCVGRSGASVSARAQANYGREELGSCLRSRMFGSADLQPCSRSRLPGRTHEA